LTLFAHVKNPDIPKIQAVRVNSEIARRIPLEGNSGENDIMSALTSVGTPSSTSETNPGKLQIDMNLNYEMILWWSAEDKAYVVDVPELPGCMAHGPTRQAAINNAVMAIKFWIKTAKDDGLEIPEPRGRLVFA
jgi:predicted RNase H-like HicB family nuclease